MSGRARTSDLTILIVAGVVVVLLAALSFAIAPGAGLPVLSGSSYTADLAGAKAAYLLLEELGYHVERSIEPLAALSRDPKRTVIVLVDPLGQPSKRDVAALRAFVENGGTVLAAGALTGLFVPQSHAVQSEQSGTITARTYHPAFPSPLTSGVPSIEMQPIVWRRTGPGWLPLFGTFDEPAVQLLHLGAGRIIWLASSDPLSNEHIAKPGHAQLLLNVMGAPGERTILWDEYYHGFARSFWSYIVGTPIAWGIAQLALVSILALFTFARRRGPIRVSETVPRTSPLEFIDTMAGLYQRSHAASAAVATARARVRRLLASKAGLPSSSSDGRFAAVLAQRPGVTVTAAAETLRRAHDAEQSGVLNDEQGLALIRALHDLERTVLDGRAPHSQEKR
jgi:Domain of unknown function (DUF4350)